jgi:hypothetical protein
MIAAGGAVPVGSEDVAGSAGAVRHGWRRTRPCGGRCIRSTSSIWMRWWGAAAGVPSAARAGRRAGGVGHRRVAGRFGSDDKQGAAANFKGGFGFHPMLCFIEPLGLAAGMLRPGNANANTIADQLAVLDQAIGSLPEVWQAGHRPGDDPAQVARVLRVRADTAAHRRSCRAHRRRDRTLPEPGRPQLQHPPDRGRPVTPAGQHRRGQQHLRDPTAPAPAPPWTHPLSPAPSTHRALPCPPPGREGRLVTRRAHQRARLQFGLDADRIRAYRHHGCGLSQQEALPVSAKTCREGFARSGTHRHCPTRQPRSNPPLPARRPHPRRRPTPPRSSSHMAPDNTSDRLPSGVNPVRGRLMAEAR